MNLLKKWKSKKMPVEVPPIVGEPDITHVIDTSTIDEFFEKSYEELRELTVKAFAYHGYSESWVIENSNRIEIKAIEKASGYSRNIYSVDGVDLFEFIRNTDFGEPNGNEYKIVTNVEIRHLK